MKNAVLVKDYFDFLLYASTRWNYLKDIFQMQDNETAKTHFETASTRLIFIQNEYCRTVYFIESLKFEYIEAHEMLQDEFFNWFNLKLQQKRNLQ